MERAIDGLRNTALCFLIFFTHAFAFLIVLYRRDFYSPESNWLLQNYILVSWSFVTSLIFCFFGRRWAGRLVSVLLFCYGLMSYSSKAFFVLDSLLLTSLCFLIGFNLPYFTALLFEILIAFLVVALKWPEAFMGRLPPMDLMISIAIVISSELFVGTLASTLSQLYRRLVQLKETNRRMDGAVTQLISANLGFQQNTFIAVEESVANERKRISRDIHDSLGYMTTSIIMMMEEAATLLGNDHSRISQLVQATRSQAEQGWAETRTALRVLRALREEEIRGVRRIFRLAKAFEQAAGVKVRLELGNFPERLPVEIELVVYRFIQEGLTNSFRHGRASTIDIFLWMTEIELRVTLRDNGTGASELKEGIGLSGLQERLQPLGGKFYAQNTLSGFELSVSIPYADQEK
jgi:signal transduction histidine kinase